MCGEARRDTWRPRSGAPESSEAPECLGFPIQTERLTKVYLARHGEIRAVDGIDLEIAAGEFFGLLGPTRRGQVDDHRHAQDLGCAPEWAHGVAGADASVEPAAVTRRIGVVSQSNTLDRLLTVWENL